MEAAPLSLFKLFQYLVDGLAWKWNSFFDGQSCFYFSISRVQTTSEIIKAPLAQVVSISQFLECKQHLRLRLHTSKTAARLLPALFCSTLVYRISEKLSAIGPSIYNPVDLHNPINTSQPLPRSFYQYFLPSKYASNLRHFYHCEA